MATDLVRSFLASDSKMWRGGSLLLTADLSVAFPAKIEDVIALVGYAPKTGWAILCPTTEDGITLAREWDESAGITVDQRDTPLRGGMPTNVRMSLTGTSMYTDVATLDYLWQLGTTAGVTTVPSQTTTVPHNTAEVYDQLGDTKRLTYKRVAVLQQQTVQTIGTPNYSRVRMMAFRQGLLNPPNSIQIHSRDAARLQFGIRFIADLTATAGTEYGMYFETTGPPVA